MAHCSKKIGKGGRCHMHARRKQKEENPTRYYFDHLRNNARNRGIEFTLTIEEFREFCGRTKYLELKGRYGASATIDRIRNWEGYSYDNIQILSNSTNRRKQYIDRKLSEKYGYSIEVPFKKNEAVEQFYRHVSADSPYWEDRPQIILPTPPDEFPF